MGEKLFRTTARPEPAKSEARARPSERRVRKFYEVVTL